MCNLYTQTKAIDEIARLFRDMGIQLSFPEGLPNLQPRDVAITDSAPIVRMVEGSFQLVVRRWSWPAPDGKPVYNFRSDGREFGNGRCLILTDGFYEFTKPADAGQKRKDRWLFTRPSEPMLGIAGLTRDVPDVGEAFTMLTTEPGPDVAPFHSRQVAVLPAVAWSDWLDYRGSARELLGPLPADTLQVQPAPRA
jgi:putative SOS response-associated peptidase YedK